MYLKKEACFLINKIFYIKLQLLTIPSGPQVNVPFLIPLSIEACSSNLNIGYNDASN